jgi:glycerophosphoryl diester phosphodiesterase
MPPPMYNPEAKIPGGTLKPNYREDAIKAIMDIVAQKKIQKRVMIQSFDLEMLEIVHRNYPRIKTSYLVYVGKSDWIANLKKLSFKPYAYSPYYKQVNKELIDYCHQNKIKVVTWTVNEKSTIDSLRVMGVDAVISDYPNLF